MATIPQEAWDAVQDGVMTVDDAANALGVHRVTVYRLMASGELVWTTVGKRRRIPRRSVERMLARNVSTASPAPQ